MKQITQARQGLYSRQLTANNINDAIANNVRNQLQAMWEAVSNQNNARILGPVTF